MNRTYRFNPLDRRNIKDRTMLMQLMEDVLGALMPPTSKQGRMVYGRAWHPERRGVQASGTSSRNVARCRMSLHWNWGILSEWGNRSNIKGHFRKKFRLFELKEEPPPAVAFRTEKEISDNYTRILKDIERGAWDGRRRSGCKFFVHR